MDISKNQQQWQTYMLQQFIIMTAMTRRRWMRGRLISGWALSEFCHPRILGPILRAGYDLPVQLIEVD
jgi:hypothetical protein